jgi:Fe2+ transport system protein FeoA
MYYGMVEPLPITLGKMPGEAITVSELGNATNIIRKGETTPLALRSGMAD